LLAVAEVVAQGAAAVALVVIVVVFLVKILGVDRQLNLPFL
jgi:hypothetical protein